MSKGINKWIGIGNCCADPEIKTFPDGNSVANVTVACDDSYKKRDTGEMVEKTEFVRVVFRGKLAEIAGQYLHKGSKVYVEGQLQTRKYQGQDGQDRYSTEVVVGVRGTMVMLDSRPQQTPQQAPQQASAGNQYQGQSQTQQGGYRPFQAQQAPQNANPPADFDESLPF